jgi:competence protein ComGC
VRAFTIAELLITVASLVLLIAIFLPALARAKARSARIGCANNLKQLGLAFRTWSLDNNGHFPMQVSVVNGGTVEVVVSGSVYPHFQVMSNELSTPKILVCPQDMKRSYATNFAIDLSDTNLSYFLNMDATGGDGSSLLAGDRNITNRPAAGSRLVPLTKADSIAWTKEIHSHQGFIAFGDGRVQSFSNRGVSSAIRVGAGATNWLAVP